jgi:aminopeptidase N
MNKKNWVKGIVILMGVSFFLGSCSFHANLQNPSVAVQYPVFDQKTILHGENSLLRKSFDVNFYGIDINVLLKKRELDGWIEIRGKVLRDIDTLQLDLDEHLFIDEIHLNTREGESLISSRIFGTLFVKLPKKIHSNEAFTLHIKYHGKPISAQRPPWEGGLVWKRDQNQKRSVGVACEGEGASIWFPCKDDTNDEPDSINMKFTIPTKRLSVVSNGIFVGSKINDKQKTFEWKTSYPINLYNITFYIGKFLKIEDSCLSISGKEILLNYYVTRDNLRRATKHFKQVKRHIRAYEELFGEYPWQKDGFKLIESPFAGMEHQTAIAIGNNYLNNINGTDSHLILHETGHEWFGNSVTAADFADMWLQEGITTYGECLYLEKEYGAKVAQKQLNLYKMFIKNNKPLVGPFGKRYFDYKDGDVYFKAAWMLHSLRNNIDNDNIFFSILKTFYYENKLKVTNSAAFIETVNRITGADYNWFFNQYLYDNRSPCLEYQFGKDGFIYYRWVEVKEGFDKLKVSLKFKMDDTNFEVYPSHVIQKFKIPENIKNEEFFKFDNQKLLFISKENQKLKDIDKLTLSR